MSLGWMRYRRAGNKSMGFSVLQTGFESYPNPALEPALKKERTRLPNLAIAGL